MNRYKEKNRRVLVLKAFKKSGNKGCGKAKIVLYDCKLDIKKAIKKPGS